MTRRERLEMVIRGEITPELVEECRAELEKLNERAAASLERAKSTDTYKENREVGEQIVRVLTDNPIQIEELGEKLGWTGSRQRLTGICTSLVREGRIGVVEMKVKGKGKRKGYYIEEA